MPGDDKATAGSADLDQACELQDDLRDPRYQQLPLPECRSAGLTKTFQEYDHSAITYRKWHRWAALIAVIGGTLAVLAAIAELAAKALCASAAVLFWIELGEGVLGCLALVSVGLGYAFQFKRKWLAERHRASRCAQLKFEFLMQPGRWMSSGAAEHYLRGELKKIRRLQDKTMVRQVVDGPLPHSAGIQADYDLLLPRETLRQLIEYYLERRLLPQKKYLGGGVDRNRDIGHWLHQLSWAFFFSSAVFVLLHFASRWPPILSRLPHALQSESFTALAALVAIALPVLAILPRALNAAFEYSRNSRRFQAAEAALKDMEDILVHDLLPQFVGQSGGDERPVRAAPVLRQLWWCEHVLVGERIEWLSLMYETEWYV